MADLKPDPVMVDLVKVEFGVIEKSMDMGKEGFYKEATFEDGSGSLGNLDSLIEEEMEKVNLEGAVNCEGKKNGEIVGVVEDCVKSNEVVGVDGSGLKSGEFVSEGDDSDTDLESESGSSSSSSSSSSGEDDDDEEEEEEQEVTGEEEEEEKEMVEEAKGEVERETDVEEGEIMDSIGEEMVGMSEEDDEDDGDGSIKTGPILSKNELKALPPVPPVNVTLQPHHQTLPVGVVLSIIGSQVIVEGVEKHNPLNEGSILWITEKRSPLGLVDEIFGPVKNPYYVVRYNLESEVPSGIQQGTLISFVPEFVNHVLNNNNLYKKGYDASGENDEEMSDEIEFSDDEKEAEYKRMLKMTKRGTSDQNIGNRKKDKKKFKNQGGNWKHDQPSAAKPSAGVGHLSRDQNQHFLPRVTTSVDHGSCSRSSGPVQGFAGGPGLVPTFPQLAQAPGFTASSNGYWTNGIPCQQPQSIGFPNGFATSGMPWLQQNQPTQPYQMPRPNGISFQQQFDTCQRLPSNFALLGGQSFCAGPAFASWPACMSQNGFNQSQVVMGLQGQQAPASMNLLEQGIPSNAFQMEHHCGSQPPSVNRGNTEASQNFNQGAHFGRGRNPYRRGGGRFRGGRGRQ